MVRLYRCNGSSVGSHATGIHRSVIPALLHEAMRFDLPLDVGALCKVKRSFADKCFTMLPNLVIQDTTEINYLAGTADARHRSCAQRCER